MGATSHSTCGVCLAEWTGESWMETYQNVLSLKMWTLVLNESLQLCVKGQYIDPFVSEAICVPIKKRVNNHWIATEQTLIKLHGPLFSNELPSTIVAQFSEGIPDNWQIVGEKWKQFIVQGGKGFFSLNLNESLTSVSSRGSRNLRSITASGEGKGRSKVLRSSAGGKQTNELQRSVQSVPADISPPTELLSPSPWLPAHKVKEINQWMNRSPVTAHIPPEPLPCLDTVLGDAALELNSKALPSNRAWTAVSPPSPFAVQKRSAFSDTNSRKKQPNHQSTPLSNANEIWPLNFSTTVSSVSLDNSLSLMSFDGNLPTDDEFRMPTNDAHGVPTVTPDRSDPKIAKMTVKSGSEKTNSSTRSLVRKNEMSPESPDENYKARPKRRHAAQKIERWRPVLGVDGCLKLQGYLVLRGDMTAGQILTTNAVVKWTGRAAFTYDNREYELIGNVNDPSGKIPPSLKTKLLKPMKIKDIIRDLQETQGLKDDVTSHFYLAPPPAPEKICTTRSGRMCRPRTPYWLNRSDWGAEYEIFYNDTSTSDVLRTPSRSRRSERIENTKSPSSPCSTPQRGGTGRSRRKVVRDRSLSPPAVRTRGKNLPPPHSSQRSVNSTLVSSSSRSVSSSSASESLNKDTSNNIADVYSITGKKNEGSDRNFVIPNCHDLTLRKECLEKTTLMGRQNHITGATIAKKSESSIVHISPSRIKVSYLSKTKTEKTPVANPSVNTPVGNRDSGNNSCLSEVKSSAEVIRFRTTRSPAKLSCEPCCGLSYTPTRSVSSSTLDSKRSKNQEIKKKLPSEKKKSSIRGNPKRNPVVSTIQRSLRSTPGKTRKQTLLKSPRLIITPVDKQKLQKKTSLQKTSLRNVNRSPVKKEMVKREEEKKKQEKKKKGKPEVKKCFSKDDTGTPNGGKRSKNKKPQRGRRIALSEESQEKVDKNEGNESVCSNESDISVGPSASVIFAMNAAAAVAAAAEAAEGKPKRGRPRAPKTLRERRERDEALAVLGDIVNEKESAATDDDPVAQLITANPLQFGPLEWCDHRAWFKSSSRKRRRPSSSEGTVSPSRSALSEGHEDATSSVATPQLLMRRPDPKQVQSYLQRLRNMQLKSYRPTRKVKADRQVNLPDIDYSMAFKSGSSSESGSEMTEEDNWENL